MQTQRVAVAEGVELAVDVWPGGGRPFLLVHGLASNARLWDGVAGALHGRGHAVAAVDQRGHGRSTKPDTGYDFATMTADLVAVARALGWERPAAVGQSWGGHVVVELAIRHPESVRGVGVVDGAVTDFQRRFPTWEECAEALAPPRLTGTPMAEMERWVRHAHPDWPEAGIRGTLANYEVRDDGTIAPWLAYDRHMQILRHLWEFRAAERVPLLSVPALFVLARREGPVRREEAEAVLSTLPAARSVWLDGDHDLHAQYPERVAELLAEAFG